VSFDPNGKHLNVVATGLRICTGMTIQPVTSQLWCVVHERDDIATTRRSNTRRTSLKALFMAGRGPSSVDTKIRDTRARRRS
jgi:hypothetical protein